MKKLKTPGESKSYIAEIVGEESRVGERMTAGALLHMMDIAAASAAARHAEVPLVTLAFDRVELLDFICHRDYVRYEATTIHVGRSSIVVMIDCFYKAPVEMDIQRGHRGFITLVAINPGGVPNRNIPGITYKTKDDLKYKEIADARSCLSRERKKQIDSLLHFDEQHLSNIYDHYPRQHTYLPKETGLTIRKKFLPRNANSLGIVFGGDTIEMMEELALAAARQFTGNLRMVTIAMEDVYFLKPISLDNIVEMEAQVIFVANTTLVVEVTVRAIDFFGFKTPYTTNSGIFTILNYDRSGQKKKIVNGLNMKDAPAELKKKYITEQVKYEIQKGLRPSRECGLDDDNAFKGNT